MKTAGSFAAIALCVAASGAAAQSLDDGRLFARMGGCNDCHTVNFAESGGTTPESEWLKGSPVGFRGPWGTTYPANLRLVLKDLSEDDWVAYAQSLETRPPMPWYDLRVAPETYLRGFYKLVRSLGDPGEPAPDYVPPDREPKTPFIVFAPPQMPK